MVLDRIFRRTTFASPQQWLIDWVHGGEPSAAGISVTPEAAAAFSTYYACVRTIAETIASLPVFVYRHLQPRGKERVPEHRVSRIIRDEPNPEVTPFQFWETILGHAASWGNGYAYIAPGGSDGAVYLWNMDPSAVTPKRDPEFVGPLVYEVTTSQGGVVRLKREQVLHIANWGWDGITGKSPAQLHKDTIGMGLQAVKQSGKVFADGSLLRGVLSYPGTIKGGTKAIRDDWRKVYGGTSNPGDIAVLQGDMKFTPVIMSAADAELISLLKWSVTEICRAFRMPPHMVQDLEKGTYNNVEQQGIEFVRSVVLPWCRRVAQEIARKLLKPEERQIYFIEHVIEGLLRGDIKTRYEAHALAIRSGWASPNDIREIESMNPIDGGDLYVMQGQMMTLDDIANPPEPAPAPTFGEPEEPPTEEEEGDETDEDSERMAALAESHRGIFEAGFRSIFRTERDKLSRAAKREIDLKEWIERFYEGHRAHVRSVLGSAVDALGGSLYQWRTGKGMTGNLDTILMAYVEGIATRHCDLHRRVVLRAVEQAGDAAEGLKTLFATWENRPAAMADQELRLLITAAREWN